MCLCLAQQSGTGLIINLSNEGASFVGRVFNSSKKCDRTLLTFFVLPQVEPSLVDGIFGDQLGWLHLPKTAENISPRRIKLQDMIERIRLKTVGFKEIGSPMSITPD